MWNPADGAINVTQLPKVHRWYCFKLLFGLFLCQRPISCAMFVASTWQWFRIVSCPAVEPVPPIWSYMGLLIPPRPPRPLSNSFGTTWLKLNVSQTVYGGVRDNVHRGKAFQFVLETLAPDRPISSITSWHYHCFCSCLGQSWGMYEYTYTYAYTHTDSMVLAMGPQN